MRIGDTVHPVLNLASARLIAGTPANPEVVSAAAIANAKRGPLVGIPGAPATIAAPLDEDESDWAVCDDATTTTAIAGDVLSDRFASGRSVLVTPRAESAATTYLLYDGWRAEVDLRNRAVVRALRAGRRCAAACFACAARRHTRGAADHRASHSCRRLAGTASLRGFTVGTVVRVDRADADGVLRRARRGVQRIGEVAADLIRFTDSQHDRDIDHRRAGRHRGAPIRRRPCPSRPFPQRGGVAHATPCVCARWQLQPGAGTNTAVLTGDSRPLDDATPVSLAQADGDGPTSTPSPFHGAAAPTSDRSRITGDGASTGALYLIDEPASCSGFATKTPPSTSV